MLAKRALTKYNVFELELDLILGWDMTKNKIFCLIASYPHDDGHYIAAIFLLLWCNFRSRLIVLHYMRVTLF